MALFEKAGGFSFLNKVNDMKIPINNNGKALILLLLLLPTL